MYDTVNMWLRENGLWDVANHLPDFQMKRTGARPYGVGHLNNMKVGIDNYGITVVGSLAKYYLGDNFQTLTRSATEQALLKMSEELHLDIGESLVCRVDVATNLLTSRPVEVYCKCLGEMSRYKRVPLPNGVRYQSNVKYPNKPPMQLEFYDKMAWAEKEGVDIPELYSGKNVLRMELRLMKRCGRQTGQRGGLTADQLYNEKVFTRLVDMMGDKYDRIRKEKSITLNNMVIKSVKDLHKCLVLKAMQEQGETAWIERFRNEQKAGLMTSNQSQALINYVRSVVRDASGFSEENVLITELDQLVHEQIRLCR